MEEAIFTEISKGKIKGKIEGKDNVYEFLLGFCSLPPPHITMDYRVLPEGEVRGFRGRSPGVLYSFLSRHGYPVPDLLKLWADQAKVVTENMLVGSADKTVNGLRSYYTELSESQIVSFVREGMSELFREASVTIVLYDYYMTKIANNWNSEVYRLLSANKGG